MSCEHKESSYIETEYGVGWSREHRRCLACGVDYKTVITRTQAAIDFSGTAHARNTDPQTSKNTNPADDNPRGRGRQRNPLLDCDPTHEADGAQGHSDPHWRHAQKPGV